jgi:hypothetical protein
MPASAPTGRRSTPGLSSYPGAGCTKVYREKVRGAHCDLRELLKLLKSLAAGDTVTVTRIDRPARSTFDPFGIVEPVVDITNNLVAASAAPVNRATAGVNSTGRAVTGPPASPPFNAGLLEANSRKQSVNI